jgi:zinc transporter ZupT
MRARNVSTLRTVLWAIFTSIPQPIFAVPAFLFVERFAPMLPIGLGFAAGAMSYVAVFELFGEAMEDLHSSTFAAVIALCSFAGMMYVQDMVKEVHMV